MKKTQLNALQKMLEDENVKGKKLLERVLWLNTTEPKYKVGDCYEVSDRGHRVYGNPVKNFTAKIVEVRVNSIDRVYTYKLEAQVKCGEKETTTNIYKSESELKYCRKCKDKVNELAEAKSKYVESLDVCL